MPELPEAGAPQTVLFAKVRERLTKSPFEPFRIVTTSGKAYDVPTADHAVVFPRLRMIYFADDDGGEVDIHALHVSSIEPVGKKRKRTAA
jgi:hypothetical protein